MSNAAETFAREGYLIVKGILSPQEVADLKPAAEALRDRVRRERPSGTRYWTGQRDRQALSDAELGLASWGINEITRPDFLVPEMVDVLGQERVDGVLQELVDQPRAWGLKMLWTPKLVGYDLGWHRDQMKADFYDYIQYKPQPQDHVQFNLALNDDDCFLVVPGSHRRSLTDEEWRSQREEPNARLPGEVVAELGPGDILFMDAHTLHRGRSAVDGDRLTLHYSVQAQWVPLRPWGEPEHFDWIASDAFLNKLSPKTRPYYERLRTAERTDDPLCFAREAARAHGWQAA
jgi:ectoine hydroxylase-related dioxygenase (phytanoyl-CoA dioxygenase family)